MAAFSSCRGEAGDVYYASGPSPYISRDGLAARRPAVGDNSGEVQLQIDELELEAGRAENVTGLCKQVRNLKNVAGDIESEANYQKIVINQLKGTLTKSQLGMKNNMSRLNNRVVNEGRKHLMHLVLFALLCFLMVYLWVKFLRG